MTKKERKAVNLLYESLTEVLDEVNRNSLMFDEKLRKKALSAKLLVDKMRQ